MRARKLTPEEIDQIRVDYRQAKNKGLSQIEILADLNDCTKQDILDALGLDKIPKAKKSGPVSAETRAEAVQRVLAGEKRALVAEVYGVSAATINNWMCQAKPPEKAKPAEQLKSFAEVTAEEEAPVQPADELPEAGEPAQKPQVDFPRLLQIKAGLHCCTELMDNRSNIPDGYLTDLHDLLVSLLDDEIEKLEVLYESNS